MTQQDEGQDTAAEIRSQFAALQVEMQRVMAEPATTTPTPTPPSVEDASETSEAIDFERIERGLEDLRRDADRLRTRLADTANSPAVNETIAALRARIEETGRQAEEGVARLNRALQGNREAVAALSLRLDGLARRLPSRWLTPLAILIGAVVIAGAVLSTTPGSLEMLLDRVGIPIDQPKLHSEAVEPPAPPSPAPAPTPDVAALPPPSSPGSTVSAPLPAQSAVATAEPPAPPAPAPAASAIPVPPPSAQPPSAEPPSTQPPAAQVAPPPTATVQPPVAAAAVARAPVPPPASAPPTATPTATPTAPPTAPTGQIVLHATADTWVAVKNRQGTELLARLMHAGERWAVPEQPSLTLSTGNAGGLELLVDGTPAPALGAVGAVRRDVPLDPLLVRAGRYAADVSTTPKPATVSR